MDQTARSRVEHRSIVEWGNHGFVLLVRYRWREPASSGYADSPMALPLGASEVFQAVEFDSAGDVGHAWLAVPAPGGKSPAFLVLRGLARPGRSRTKNGGSRIFSRKVASARSSWSGGKSRRDGAGRGGEGMGKADLVRGDARRVHAGADELADGLVDGEQCPHLLGDALGVLAAQHRLALAHVGLVVADHGLAA